MKKLSWIVVVMILGLFLSLNVQAQDMAEDYEEEELVGRPAKFVDGVFGVYYDRGNRQNHYIPSGWMGDHGDIKMNENCKENPHSGKSCIKFTYTAEGKQGANWCGVAWQNPANNWGEKNGGKDLTGATKLTFWARGEQGNERILEFKFGGIGGTYADSDSMGIGPIDVTTEWQQYTIDLTDTDLSYIIGGFCWSTNADANPDGCVFYLDDIQYEK
ncbi:MAG: hypothetical protein GY853_03760 [PVC group bacterium]|nr:hypothetical protein [PVC group bacterium]